MLSTFKKGGAKCYQPLKKVEPKCYQPLKGGYTFNIN